MQPGVRCWGKCPAAGCAGAFPVFLSGDRKKGRDYKQGLAPARCGGRYAGMFYLRHCGRIQKNGEQANPCLTKRGGGNYKLTPSSGM